MLTWSIANCTLWNFLELVSKLGDKKQVRKKLKYFTPFGDSPHPHILIHLISLLSRSIQSHFLIYFQKLDYSYMTMNMWKELLQYYMSLPLGTAPHRVVKKLEISVISINYELFSMKFIISHLARQWKWVKNCWTLPPPLGVAAAPHLIF